MAGVAAGLVASFAMDVFQKAWTALAADKETNKNDKPKPATLKAADKVSQAVAGKVVPDQAQTAASAGVHYVTGAALGAVYGVAAEFAPATTFGFGGLYGSATWLVLDEGLSPALGLAPRPGDVAAADHAYALVSHLVFGAALEFTRGAASRLLSWEPIAG
ncbi:DUF1440 domain-containing protein [Caulobacter sp. DWR1-3-2b1]|uniref:DUF1440 domain-containing protein n=1 Tax=Caulobacter sp. DWR1-3-2b1 TaxID=2804670 RepID=UPI003CF55527